jgi:hypothetical protein
LLGVIACIFSSGPVYGAAPEVLIYSDQSAGALLDAASLKHAKLTQGCEVTFKTDASEFDAQILCRPWVQIIVVARYSAVGGTYVSTLRQFAVSNPGAMVYLHLWHDDGWTVAPDIVVTASVAQTVWIDGLTLATYARCRDAADPPPEHPCIRQYDGQVWPAFDGIVPQKPQAFIKLPPEANQNRDTFDLVMYLTGRSGDCVELCENEFEEEEVRCWNTFMRNRANCYTRFPNDPVGRIGCFVQAATVYNNCLQGAIFTRENCLGTCPETPKPIAGDEGITR